MCESLSSLMPPSPSPPRPSRSPGRQPPEYKHFCRVCNKGFTCGSALGGHMRAHGASDVDGFGADDDLLGEEASARCLGADQWDAVGTSATHAYALRANPNRLIRSCQVCKNCGKEFASWELFLQHGRCNSEDEREEEEVDGSGSLRSSSPPSDIDGEEDPAVAAAWSKGKRSRRVRAEDPSSMAPPERSTLGEEEDLANCLVMLSSSKSNNEQAAITTTTDHQEPACTKVGDGEPPLQPQPISFFTQVQESVVALPSPVATVTQYITPASRGVFECKACKKVFTSHQALGGHRASHKKVKGCFAARFESNAASEPARHSDTNNGAGTGTGTGNGKAAAVDEGNAGASADATRIFTTTGVEANVGTSTEATSSLPLALVPIGHNPPPATTLAVTAQYKKNAKMHECSVCHRLFTSGQALGGHKRCHWLTSNTSDPYNPVAASMIPPLTEDLVGVVKHQLSLRPMADVSEPVLDLTIAANPVALAASTARQEASSSSFRLDVAPAVHLQPLVVAVPGNVSHRKKAAATSSRSTDAVAEEDEADSTTAKRAKISDLKDVVSMDGEPTEPWLQVGIGSSSAAGDDS